MFSPEFRFRPYEDDDLPRVLEVMKASLGETEVLHRTPELFAWKHIDNPFGRSILLVAEAGDRIAGLRAFMRWELITPSGDRLRCVRPVDTATHPDFQRMGLFKRLTEHAVQMARDDGVDLIFNTPNPQSGAGYQKMGWTIVGQFGVMARPALGLVGLKSSFTPPSGDDASQLRDRAPMGLRTATSPEYFRWRFHGHPTASYSTFGDTDGACVVRWNTRKGRRERVVSGLYGDATRTLRRALRVRGCDYTVAWFQPGSPERALAVRHGLVPVPRLTSLTLAANPLRRLPVDPTRIGAWDVALSDLELL